MGIGVSTNVDVSAVIRIHTGVNDWFCGWGYMCGSVVWWRLCVEVGCLYARACVERLRVRLRPKASALLLRFVLTLHYSVGFWWW